MYLCIGNLRRRRLCITIKMRFPALIFRTCIAGMRFTIIFRVQTGFFNKKYYACVGNDLFVVPKVCVHKALIRPDTPDGMLGKALLVIEENFRDIKVSDIAKKLFISNSHFSKLFAAECGVTPLNYLLLRKIAEAKKYLYMGISVKEACLLFGFSDYSNFIRTFKNIEGCSPGSFEMLSKPL